MRWDLVIFYVLIAVFFFYLGRAWNSETLEQRMARRGQVYNGWED